jgi:hypothetical protein
MTADILLAVTLLPVRRILSYFLNLLAPAVQREMAGNQTVALNLAKLARQ